jgi:hypothetical protein
MGTGTAVVMYADTNAVDVLRAAPILDRTGTLAVVQRLFPEQDVAEIGNALLAEAVNPAEDVVYVGCFPGLEIVCGWQMVTERPSDAAKHILSGPERRTVYLHAMHTVVDWCAFGLWTDGQLIRALSVSPGSGVVEDIGDRLPFEEPYWAGEREGCPADDGHHPLSFHPVALAKAALHAFFGFRLNGDDSLDDVDPEIIPLVGYRIAASAANAA